MVKRLHLKASPPAVVLAGERIWGGWILRRAILVLFEFWISAFRSNFTSGLETICSWDAGQGHRASFWLQGGGRPHLSLYKEVL